MTLRPDETWHRLREWTSGQTPSERLAAQVLIKAGYQEIDPSHPLGGKDGGKDAMCSRDGKTWIMAAYFPRGEHSFTDIKGKFLADLAGVSNNSANGIAFVTNQELRLAERNDLVDAAAAAGSECDLFHLERLTAVLDDPSMLSIRRQYLNIDFSENEISRKIESEIATATRKLQGFQTGGDTFCYFMLYYFDVNQNIAKNICVIKQGEFPLYDLRIRIVDMDEPTKDVWLRQWGEISAPAEFAPGAWKLKPNVYYRIFFHARNGQWHQDLQLRKSRKADCWLAATKVYGTDGRTLRLEHYDTDAQPDKDSMVWRP